VEHDILQGWAAENGISLTNEKEQTLIQYAELIHETNQKFNLTGFKTVNEIITNLIIGSLDPVIRMKVPRGTLFADIGTGAGVPGIPLAVYSGNWKGLCIDSNSKKVTFVDSVIRECEINNLQVHNGRLELLAREEMRSSFEYVFSRALGEIYFVLEVGAPLLKTGGLLYVYSHAAPEDLPLAVTRHATELGLSLLERGRYSEYGIQETGILLLKTGTTDSRYPRNITAIKRDIQRKIKVP
jgi:16S rRNA (guanine527-N7)-methyltransferase